MITAQSVHDIVATYETHGWHLRRVLLSPAAMAAIGKELSTRLPECLVKEAGLDAAWFSRPPMAGEVTWELRSLGARPFALLEWVDENSEDFEQRLAAVEHQMIDAGAGGTQA